MPIRAVMIAVEARFRPVRDLIVPIARNAEPRCGLQVIDLRSGEVVDWVRLEGMVSELYDVAVLPGAVRPMAVGFKTDEIQRLITVDQEQAL